MDKLDAAAIALPGAEARVVDRCTSTNDLLLKERIGERPLLVAAEEQSAGRGRRGRRWYSTPGAGITFSLGRRVRRPARELAGLSLVAGIAVVRALHALGLGRVRLKWPNDLVVDGAKLGGILVETRGASHVVIGIGLNYRRTRGLQAKVRRKLAFIDELAHVSRNRVIQAVGVGLLETLERFDAQGFDGLRADWEALDAYAGQRLRVRLADGRTLSGIAVGIGENGSLRIRNKRGMQAVTSGRVVSARAA
jgi:BirA family transcriptional regulator, biotin operon repressor / biotin---[acetyl-CoA-carboxylase] ligase